MLTLQLQYAPDAQGEIRGWYLPCAELHAWLDACANQSMGSTKVYLAPRSMADHTAQGLIALRDMDQPTSKASSDQSVHCPTGAVPLVCLRQDKSDVELWLPLFTRLMPAVPIEQLLSGQQWSDAKRLVWLPPDDAGGDRLIRVDTDDEIDISVLLKPPPPAASVAATRWLRPPIAPQLPDRVTGLQISRELLSATPFIDEGQSIGGDVDDLISLDDEGRTSGGGLSSAASRWFRQKLHKLLKSLQKRFPPQPPHSTKPQGASPDSASPAGRAHKPSALGQAGAFLSKRLNALLTGQREQQLEKLLALMARDPDRALKYALPMSLQSAPRGFAQSGANLTRNNVDFSLAKLFGGGRPADPWNLNARLQAKLLAAYRQQAEREQAAGRYRRAAYIYGHLVGDLSSAAMMLEKGKFFIEAAALYQHLRRFSDQARCLRSSGQLSEAAAIYERLGDYASAAQMWSDVGHHEAARIAWEQACEAALKQYDILKAVNILETRLGDVARAETLLWQQWPRGHQVLECTRLGFKRLADQGRESDAQTRLSDIVARTGRAEQTLLAKLCAELFKSFPNEEFRQRAEDQCRVSVVDHLNVAASSEFTQRMQILGNLHSDDILLRRDVRRFEREFKSAELQLQPEPKPAAQRRKLILLGTARVGEGAYCAAVMVNQQLFTISKSGEAMLCSRYAQLADGNPVANHCRVEFNHWDTHHQPCCFVHRGSDPKVVQVGYFKNIPKARLLVSPLGGDDFWLISSVTADQGVMVGISEDGRQWWWDREKHTMTSLLDGLPRVTDFGGLIRAKLLTQLREHGMDEVLSQSELSTATQRQVVTHVGQPFIAYRDTVMGIEQGKPAEIATLPGTIRWMVPSLPFTMPRLLVATEHALWMVSVSSGVRPELIMQDEQFTQAIFLPGGRVAAVTSRELLLFQRGHQSMWLLARQELQHPNVVALLSLTAETLGILYTFGELERYRIV